MSLRRDGVTYFGALIAFSIVALGFCDFSRLEPKRTISVHWDTFSSRCLVLLDDGAWSVATLVNW